jgi:nicotinate phosphoribosyltransferase
VFKEMRERGIPGRPAIRLDSGDLAKLSKAAWRMMTDAGLDDPLIVASNDLEEDLIADLKRQGAKINAWGVGTHLITSHDYPSLNGVYKLVSVEEGGRWVPRIKTTSNVEKATDPCRKQVVRYHDADGAPIGDILYELDEDFPAQGDIQGHHRVQPHLHTRLRGAAGATPLLETVVENGARVADPPPIQEVREHALGQIRSLPDEYKRLRNPEIYKVMLSERIGHTKERLVENPDGR